MDFLIQLILTGIIVGSIYSVLAIGFVLIYKSSKVFNFAQGQFVLIGAYLGFSCLSEFQMSAFATVIVLCISSFIIGYACDRIFLEKMIGQAILPSIMMTIALSYVLEGTSFIAWGGMTESYPSIYGIITVRILNAKLPIEYLIILGVAIFMVIALLVFFNYTRLGLAMKSTAESHEVSQALGVNVKNVFAFSWAIAALSGCLGGALLANINGVSPDFSEFGLKVFPVVILGGLESIPGAIIGGMSLGLIEYLSMGYIDSILPGFHTIVAYFILILILLIKPYGLFGLVRIERI